MSVLAGSAGAMACYQIVMDGVAAVRRGRVGAGVLLRPVGRLRPEVVPNVPLRARSHHNGQQHERTDRQAKGSGWPRNTLRGLLLHLGPGGKTVNYEKAKSRKPNSAFPIVRISNSNETCHLHLPLC